MKAATNFITEINGCKIWIRREDEFGEGIKGNKYRKLKYNILKAKTNNSKGIITFGGAFSNHLFATALAGKINGIKTFGIVRGDEWSYKVKENPTLTKVLIRVEAAPINPSDLGLLLSFGADLTSINVTGSGDETITSIKIHPGLIGAMKPRLDESMQVGNEGSGVICRCWCER